MTRLSYPGNIWGNILQFRLAPNPTPGPLPLVNSWNAPSETFVLNPSQSSRLPASRLVRLGTHILQSGVWNGMKACVSSTTKTRAVDLRRA